MVAVFHRQTANATEVKQVDTFTITAASTGGTAVWTLTLTLSNGDTHTVAYTETSTTISEITAGLEAAIAASSNPWFIELDEASDATTVTVTAATAGIPFTLTLADDSDGTHTKASTTANLGDYDWGTTANWSNDNIPSSSDSITFPQGSQDVLYTLDQTGVTTSDIAILEGCASKFGQFKYGTPLYARFIAGSFDYRGSGGLSMWDLGSANIPVYIKATGAPATTGRHAFYLKGTNLTTVDIVQGDVGIAVLKGEVSTVATVNVSYVTSLTSDSKVTIGSGVTLTTLNVLGGTCRMDCGATTVTVDALTTLTTGGSGAITTLNLHGTGILNSSGTITTLNCYGHADFSQSKEARTITTLVQKVGGKITYNANTTISNVTLLAGPDKGKFEMNFV